MKFKRVLALSAATVMALGSFTGCASSNQGGSATPEPSKDTTQTATSTEKETEKPKDVTLKVWGPQEDQVATANAPKGILPAMCENFAAQHPEWNITFEYGVCGEDIAKDEVTKDVNAAADVYFLANDQIPILVEAGAIAKLGGTTVDTIKGTNDGSMVTSVSYQDSIYAVPFTPNTWFMYYDKSKFTEDEVKSLDVMMSKDLGEGVSNFAFPLTNSWYIASFYYGAGGTLFGDGTDPAGGCTFNSPEGVEVTKYLVNLAKNPKFSNEQDGSSIAKFKEGKLGAYCSGSWDAAAIKEALGDNFAATKIPTFKVAGVDGQMKSFAGSKAIGVNPTSKNPEVAVALALYLGSEEAQVFRFEERGIIPTNTNAAQNEAVKADVVASAQMLEIKEASVAQPVLKEMGSYWSPAEVLGKEIVQGDVTEDNAADKLAKFVDAVVNPSN